MKKVMSTYLVSMARYRKKDWISLLKKHRNLETNSFVLKDAIGTPIRLEGPHIAVEDLVPRIPPTAYRAVTVRDNTSWTVTLAVRIVGLGKVRLVVSFAKADVTGTYAVLVTHRVDWSAQRILALYLQRWPIEIDIRDGHAYYGIAQDQCRKFEHIGGANTLRLLMAAARTLWFIVTSEQHADVALQRFRPWYRHKVAPSQFDVAWACREVLQEAGIFPIPRFFTAVAENQQEIDKPKPIAA